MVSFFCEFEVFYKPTFSVSKKVLFCFPTVIIMLLFTCGSVHQGDERFSNDSRGKQCSFISLIALFVEKTIPVCEWNCQTVDNILSLGDRMYLHALKNQLIPSTELLSVTNLPSVQCTWM